MNNFNLLLVLSLVGCAAFLAPEAEPIRVYIIGDSTASPYDGGTFPRTGWAQALQPFFDRDSVYILNKARSGRSSKSYYNESAGWAAVKSQLQAGDYLMIQFGHNDSKSDTARYTEPFTTYKEYLQRYIDEARALGVTPVLMSSIHRNSWENDTLNIKDTHGDYLIAVRQMADSFLVPLIDMAVKTEELYESYGYTRATEEIFLNLPPDVYPAYLTGNVDNTHLQETGAYAIANLAVEAIAQATDSQLTQLQSGIFQVQQIFARVDPPLSGYLKGQRYFPVNTNKGLLALPAAGYDFVRWRLDGNELATQPLYAFSVESGDSAVRVAEFTMEANSLEEQFPGVKIFPSPADDSIVISSPSPFDYCELMNMEGKIVRKFTFDSLTQELRLPVSDLPSGHYHLRVKLGEKTGSKLIQIIH